MKKTNKTINKERTAGKRPSGVIELFAALGVAVLVGLLIFGIHSCESRPSVKDGIMNDSVVSSKGPTQTVMNPIPVKEAILPLQLAKGVTVDQVYTSTGYFPEDGTDKAMKGVFAVKLTNTSEQTLEYLTFTLKVNGEKYKFAAATVPAKKSVYVFNSKSKKAPDKISALEGEEEVKTYFPTEPSKKIGTLSYSVNTGSIVVKNISKRDINSDIMVYYKSTADGGYLGGITYRFRIKGGLDAGKSHTAFAPHAYAHMTEIMFVQYEE
jgi:hypothetical protein